MYAFDAGAVPGWHRTARRIGLGLLLLLAAGWSLDFLLSVAGKYRDVDPATYTMFWERRGWLWVHLGGGALTLVLGLVQFLTQWPRAHAGLHRVSGRVYLFGMLIACAGACGLIATSAAPLAIRLAFAATAWAWLGTALWGLQAIRQGRVPDHRRWMVRSYLVTLAPISFRLMLHAPGVFTLVPPPPDGIAWLLWLSWVVPLSAYELAWRSMALQRRWRDRRRGPVLSAP